MAWRSSGETNEELVDNMVANGLISSPEIEDAFRNVDRKHFVPKGYENQAYSDRPLKKGHVHLSAPHIYCSVLEALELHPGASLSFLNIGSGSGYFSCIVSQILGSRSCYYGVDIHEDVVTHCRSSVEKWFEDLSTTNNHSQLRPMMQFFHGNGLNIQSDVGESMHGFDRIYAGAAISISQLKKVQMLLRPGGVLVAPVEDDLLKVVRIRAGLATATSTSTSQGLDNYGVETDENNHGFTTQTISGVTFAPLLTRPQIETIIPSTKWSTANHRFYPDSFQKATKTILLCRNSNFIQPVTVQSKNFSASLPKEVWMHILSFTTRMWFEPDNSFIQTEMLQSRLDQEQRNLNRTRQVLAATETQNLILEHQNQMYLRVAKQLYESIQDIVRLSPNESSSSKGVQPSRENIIAAQSILEESRNILFPIGAHVNDEASFDFMEEEEDAEENESGGDSDSDSDEEMGEDMDSVDDLSDRPMMESASSSSTSLLHVNQSNDNNNTRQLRTVSISSLDL